MEIKNSKLNTKNVSYPDNGKKLNAEKFIQEVKRIRESMTPKDKGLFEQYANRASK